MKKKLKLMAEYGSSGLWLSDDNGEIDDEPEPDDLPLSAKTIDRLKKWSAAYNAKLNLQDPASSGFASKEEGEAFESEGVSLWHTLREELGDEYEVEYFSEKLNRTMSDESELVSYR